MTPPSLIRAPNHLGDLVMALPAIRASGGSDVLVLRWLAPFLEMAREAEPQAAGVREIISLERGTREMLRVARLLRARRYRSGVLLPPSLSSALLFAMGGVRERRGVATDARGPLLTQRVEPPPPATHRAAGYLRLVTGSEETAPPSVTLGVTARQHERWRAVAGDPGDTLVGISPGSNAGSRRWPAESFAALVGRLGASGLRVVVFGGPGERELIDFVAGSHALAVGGTPDLPLLSAGLAACDVVVTNDTGPMHVAAAVGTRTVAIIGPSDPRLTGPLGPGHVQLVAGALPCLGCGRNECPRTGPGTRLERAENECMRLVSVADVESAVLGVLTQHPIRGG